MLHANALRAGRMQGLWALVRCIQWDLVHLSKRMAWGIVQKYRARSMLSATAMFVAEENVASWGANTHGVSQVI